DQEGDEILKLARTHLQKNLPKGVTLEVTDGHSGPWYLTDPHSKIGEAAQRALREAFNRDPALIREGGSIPIVSQFRAILGIETLLMGLALPDCRAHSPTKIFLSKISRAGFVSTKQFSRNWRAEQAQAGSPVRKSMLL